jgi:alkanesulfonate monooxygenase SsuD/methylene tetrahydromethanopterin reductase-like flavin-dependent oxidoreductase (luciferase family)
MRYALYADRRRMEWDRLLATWQTADAIDLYESAWTFDHLHLYPEHLAPVRERRSFRGAIRARVRNRRLTAEFEGVGPCLEGWVSLTALLQATVRLRGGCLVTGMLYRHPAVVAKMAATLDVISGGRLELGLGAGWSVQESEAYGLHLGTAAERADRLDEGVACIVGLLSNPTTTFRGSQFHLVDARCEPKPIQRPHPPICIGGTGERRTIPAVARWAQLWHAGFDVSVLARKREVLARCCAAIGREVEDITICMVVYWDGQSIDYLVDAVGHLEQAGAGLVMLSLDENDPRLVEVAASALSQLTVP